MFKLIILMLVTQVFSNPCSDNESLNITSGVSHPNGSIVYKGIEYIDGTWYRHENDSEILFGCPCLVRVCLWKCCGENQAYLNRSCLDYDSEVIPFNPAVYMGKEITNISAVDHFYYMYNIGCDKYLVDSNSSSEELYLQENGTLYEIAFNVNQWHKPSKFCLDMMSDSSSTRLVAGVCYPEEETTGDSSVLYIAYGVGLIMSVPFLLATFLVYAFIPELRNLHGLCLMAYCGGLIVAYSFLAYLKMHVGKVGVAMTGCYVIGVMLIIATLNRLAIAGGDIFALAALLPATHPIDGDAIIAFIVYYAFQTSFFWLNVMCFDIWRTFSSYRGSSNKKKDTKRFLFYGLYAWGIPIVLTSFTLLMQFSENLPASIVTPGFGNRRCWFNNWLSELAYFFTPVFLLVICNVVLFSVTANRIRSIRNETAILKGAESSRSDKLKKDKQRYSLYLKLFVVMGVNWTVEVISFAVGGSNWYWVVVDIANIALGIYIFFVFVWKKKVRNLAAKRWRSIRGVQASESTVGRWATRSSAATEDTRISADETGIRLKEMH